MAHSDWKKKLRFAGFYVPLALAALLTVSLTEAGCTDRSEAASVKIEKVRPPAIEPYTDPETPAESHVLAILEAEGDYETTDEIHVSAFQGGQEMFNGKVTGTTRFEVKHIDLSQAEVTSTCTSVEGEGNDIFKIGFLEPFKTKQLNKVTHETINESGDTLSSSDSDSTTTSLHIPTHPLKVGDTWSGEVTHEGQNYAIQYEVMGFEDIQGERCAKLHYQTRYGGDKGGTSVRFQDEGDQWLNITLGMFVKAEKSVEINGAMTIKFGGTSITKRLVKLESND